MESEIERAAKAWRAAYKALSVARDDATPKYDETTKQPIPPTQAQHDAYNAAVLAFAETEHALNAAIDAADGDKGGEGVNRFPAGVGMSQSGRFCKFCRRPYYEGDGCYDVDGLDCRGIQIAALKSAIHVPASEARR